MMGGGENFSQNEREVLKRFVTNTDGDVFVLTNLPEVIKGALFSRYSRSTKGLRRLLLDEFLNNPGGGFLLEDESIEPTRKLLRLRKAQEFYDRILDGYGDDSIGELGGAHLAFERISNIASKAIEDCRIGGSPLEKSTRYVRFDQKEGGEYQYYREPRILESRHADSYIGMMDELFETYSRHIGPLQEYVRERVPREEGTPKWAYESSVRAYALDALRGLLPASTLTNVGLFGNGRFFEGLLVKLKSHPLQEMRDLGSSAQEELEKVVSSFVRRAREDNKHFPARVAHRRSVRSALAESAKIFAANPSRHEGAVLVDLDEDAEDRVLAALLYPHSHLSFSELIKKVRALPPGERDSILNAGLTERKNRRHKPGRAFEHATYTFDICADFGCYRDLQRHRMLTQERQLLSTRHGYGVPRLLLDAGIAEEYREAMDRAAEVYERIAADLPEEAQYAVPFGYRLRWYFRVNLRALVWLCELRTTPHGHQNYREIAQQMYAEVKRAQPRLARAFKFVDMNSYELGRLQSEVRAAEKKEGLED